MQQIQAPTSIIQSTPLGMYHEIRIQDAFIRQEDWVEVLQVIDSGGEHDIIHLKINGDGGNVAILYDFLSSMEQCPSHIITEITGTCSSAFTFVFLKGDELRVNAYSEMMFHEMQYGEYGTSSAVKDRVDFRTKRCSSLIRKEYKHFLTEEEIESILKGTEIYLDSEAILERLNIRIELLREESEGSTEESGNSVEEESDWAFQLSDEEGNFLNVDKKGYINFGEGNFKDFKSTSGFGGMEFLKSMAVLLGVSYAHNISAEKLRVKLDNKIQALLQHGTSLKDHAHI